MSNKIINIEFNLGSTSKNSYIEMSYLVDPVNERVIHFTHNVNDIARELLDNFSEICCKEYNEEFIIKFLLNSPKKNNYESLDIVIDAIRYLLAWECEDQAEYKNALFDLKWYIATGNVITHDVKSLEEFTYYVKRDMLKLLLDEKNHYMKLKNDISSSVDEHMEYSLEGVDD